MKTTFPKYSVGATTTEKNNTPVRRSFREISRDYFKREALETFIAEAAFFSVITIIAVFGMMICAEALAHSIRAGCMI
jgi:hypothetical protein